MTPIFIIHGVSGHPQENWFPWLKTELEKLNQTVIVPQFPTPENQNLDSWMKVIEHHQKFLTPETILIGHSLGVPFLLSVIEKYPVKAAFFVAGFVGKAGNDFDESMKTFTRKFFNWPNIKNNCHNFCLFHSDNDPYIKLEKAKELADKLNVEVTLVPGAGHFNTSAGYDRFDLLLEKIKSVTGNL